MKQVESQLLMRHYEGFLELVRIVLLGPPGRGRGHRRTGWPPGIDLPLISTGDIFRRNVRASTELGAKAKKYMDTGELVPDDVVVRMVLARLDQTPKGFVLDGFPRTMPQAGEARERHHRERAGR